MSNHGSAPLEERYFLFEQQEVTIHDFESLGYVLDIGGGGEGIIGILKGEKAIAIDTRKEELEEAADGPLKIIMDARNLQFLDSTFNTVTAFFTLMYLKSKPDHEEVFSEVFRVLKPGGQFLIWDVSVPQRPKGKERNYLVPVTVTVKDRVIDTGYGQPRPEEEHDLAFFVDIAEKSGFQVLERREDGQTFFLQLQKP